MLIYFVIASVLAQLIMALFVFINNPKNIVNKSFSLLSFSLLAWATLNYLNYLPDFKDNITIMRLIMFFVVAQNFFFTLFTYSISYNNLKLKNNTKLKAYSLLSLTTGLVTLSPFFFTRVDIGEFGPYPVPGPGMMLFIIHAFLSIYFSFKRLLRSRKSANRNKRSQLQLIIIGSVILWGVTPLTNFLFALTIKTSLFIQFSPLYAFIFSSIIAFAIVSHKLFDIRAAVTRSVTYMLLIGTMSITYSAVVFGLINTIFNKPSQQTLRETLSVLAITPLLLSFQNIKQFFDKITIRLFYRNSYDTQIVLDEIGDILVNDINLTIITKNISDTLIDALKSSFVEFITLDNNLINLKNIKSYLEPVELQNIINYAFNHRNNLIIFEGLSLSSSMRKFYTTSGVAISLRLKTRQQTIGFILLGAKKSGNIYSEQDKKLLSTASGELAIALQNVLRFEEIQQFNATLQNKVNQQTAKLKNTNEKLKKLDEAKDDFISIASHQLRTPLTAISGYCSILQEGYGGRKPNKKESEYLNRISASSKRMGNTISDLLNLSRLKTGKFVAEVEECNLTNIVKEEIKQVQELADNRKIQINFIEPDNLSNVTLDKSKISQVIMNFIDNAIFYSNDGGKVDVSLESIKNNIIFKVTDTGIGIPTYQQAQLFSKFFRADNAKQTRPDGTGIGLYMAKKSIEVHGGKIIFESKLGKGSTFGFSISKNNLEKLKSLAKNH